MKRILLIFILPVLIFCLIAYSTFWFIKSGEIKKNITKLIESNPNSSIASIKSSGFPFSNKIVINEVSFEISGPADDKSHIAIPQIIAQSSIFSSEFDIKIIGDIAITNPQNQTHLVTFNANPLIKLFTDGFKVNKISYVDSGYKILDESRIAIFSVGNSTLDLTMEGEDIKTTSLKANFINISGFDMLHFGDKFLNIANEAGAVKTLEVKEIPSTPEVATPVTNLVASQAVNSDAAKTTAEVATTSVVESNPAKIAAEVKKDEKLPELPVINLPKEVNNQVPISENSQTQDTHRSFAIDATFKSNKSKITNIILNNFEIISPLYQINIKGSANAVNEANPGLNLNIKIQNFDNILIYLRQYLAAIVPADLEIKTQEQNIVTLEDKTVTITQAAVAKKDKNEANKTQIIEAVVPSPEIIVKPDLDDIIVGAISDIAKKNVKTTEKSAEFDIVANGADFSINNLTVGEIMIMFQPALEVLMPILIKNTAIIDEKAILGDIDPSAPKAGVVIAPIEKTNDIEVAKPAIVQPTITPPSPTIPVIQPTTKKDVDFGTKMGGDKNRIDTTKPGAETTKNKSTL